MHVAGDAGAFAIERVLLLEAADASAHAAADGEADERGKGEGGRERAGEPETHRFPQARAR